MNSLVNTSVENAIQLLDKFVVAPETGLPENIFYYISRTTPLINVDLLLQDSQQGTLLSWRDDKHTGKGWHIPGGIIRYKETIERRIQIVAEEEIGTIINCNYSPIAVNEIISHKQQNRAHFISMLFRCRVPTNYIIDNRSLRSNDPGYLKWHINCPKNLLSWHEIYREYF
jgi:ADP-ribose pyrophosphatase YjhB (NUDIX family)